MRKIDARCRRWCCCRRGGCSTPHRCAGGKRKPRAAWASDEDVLLARLRRLKEDLERMDWSDEAAWGRVAPANRPTQRGRPDGIQHRRRRHQAALSRSAPFSPSTRTTEEDANEFSVAQPMGMITRNKWSKAGQIVGTFLFQLTNLFFIIAVVVPAVYLSVPDLFPKMFLNLPIPPVTDFLPQPKFQSVSVNPITKERHTSEFSLQLLKDAAREHQIAAESPGDFLKRVFRRLSGNNAVLLAPPTVQSAKPFYLSIAFGALGVISFTLESVYTFLWLFGLLVWRRSGGEVGRKRFDRLQAGWLALWKKVLGVSVWILTPLYWGYIVKHFESMYPGYTYSITNMKWMLMGGALWFLVSAGLFAYAYWRYKRSS